MDLFVFAGLPVLLDEAVPAPACATDAVDNAPIVTGTFKAGVTVVLAPMETGIVPGVPLINGESPIWEVGIC